MPSDTARPEPESELATAVETGGTRTVARALTLLEAVCDATDGAPLTELARRVELSASTTSRLLRTLRDQGFVDRDDAGLHRIGPRLRRIAVAALREEPLHELAGPSLIALAQETGETASLAVALDGESVLYLRQEPSPRAVRAAGWTGRTVPRATTALGAALDGRVGDEGFVVAHGAVEDDVTSIAAPIVGATGTIVGVLSVLAPRYRTDRATERAHGRCVVRHCGALSARLGAGAPGQDPETSAIGGL